MVSKRSLNESLPKMASGSQTVSCDYTSPDEPEVRLSRDQELVLPDILPGFAARLSRFFA